jgi:hypothetical protein
LVNTHHLTGFDYKHLRRRSMKLVKNVVLAGLLVFAITGNTLGGEVQTPPFASPTPPPPDKIAVCEDGKCPSDDPYTGEITTETTDYLFFEALAALLSVY